MPSSSSIGLVLPEVFKLTNPRVAFWRKIYLVTSTFPTNALVVLFFVQGGEKERSKPSSPSSPLEQPEHVALKVPSAWSPGEVDQNKQFHDGPKVLKWWHTIRFYAFKWDEQCLLDIYIQISHYNYYINLCNVWRHISSYREFLLDFLSEASRLPELLLSPFKQSLGGSNKAQTAMPKLSWMTWWLDDLILIFSALYQGSNELQLQSPDTCLPRWVIEFNHNSRVP